MATAPVFGAVYLGATPSTTSPKTVSITVAAGDTLVAYGSTADSTTTLATPTGGTGITWALQSSVVGFTNSSNCYMWTTTVASAQTFTFSITRTGSASFWWGFWVAKFSAVGGFGTPTATHITTTGAPSLAITTTKANSNLIVGNVDFVPVSGTSRTWRTINGITPTAANSQELCYQFVTSNMTQYGAYYPNVVTPGAYTAGMTAPTGQTYSIIAMEIFPVPDSNTAGFMPFFGMGHHENELEQRSSGLYVQRRKLAGIRPNGGKDRVLARV